MKELTEMLSTKNKLIGTEFLPPKSPNLTDMVNKALKVSRVVDSLSVPELKTNPRRIFAYLFTRWSNTPKS